MKKNEVLELSVQFALKIAAKEAEETDYWLSIINEIDTYPKPSESILSDLKSIVNLLNKTIITLKTKK